MLEYTNQKKNNIAYKSVDSNSYENNLNVSTHTLTWLNANTHTHDLNEYVSVFLLNFVILFILFAFNMILFGCRPYKL